MKRLAFAALCLLLLCGAALAECALPELEEYREPVGETRDVPTFERLLESPDAVSSMRTFAIAADGQIAVWSQITVAREHVGRLLILNAGGEKQGEYLLDYAPSNGKRKLLFYAADGRLCLASGTRTGKSTVFVLNPESGLVEERYRIPSLEALRPYACMRNDVFKATYDDIIDSRAFSYSERYDSIYKLAGHTDSTITVKRRYGEGEAFTIYDETGKVERYEREAARGRRIFIFAVLIPSHLLMALMWRGYIWIRRQNGEPAIRTLRKRNGEPLFRGFWK